MARQEIPMVINLRQNKNSSSNGFGKWYPEADSKEPRQTAGAYLFLCVRNHLWVN
ncbi:MAG: hypothetical protein K6F74_04030 [Prevotella sp.]|nr:hypothetical protein [Prevotella sp.]